MALRPARVDRFVPQDTYLFGETVAATLPSDAGIYRRTSARSAGIANLDGDIRIFEAYETLWGSGITFPGQSSVRRSPAVIRDPRF